MSAITQPIASVVSAGITTTANAASNAATNAANVRMNNSTNESNRQIARETNQAQIDIAKETNQTNVQLQREQNQWNLEQWQRNNEYNSPVEQMKRLQAAGLNPVTFGDNMSSGASSSPAAGTPAPLMQTPQLQMGAPMNAAKLDPLTLDSSLSQSILSAFNSQVDADLKGSQKDLNQASVKSIDAQIQLWNDQHNINLAQFPYVAETAFWIQQDNKYSAKCKRANQRLTEIGVQECRAKIYSIYQKVAQEWYNVSIAQQNADTNTANALTSAQRVENDWKKITVELEQKSTDQFIQFASHFVNSRGKGTSANQQRGSSTTKSSSDSYGAKFGASAFGTEASIEGSSTSSESANYTNNFGLTNSNNENSTELDAQRAYEEFTQYCALSADAVRRLSSTGLSASDHKALIKICKDLLNKNMSDIHGYQMAAVTKGALIDALLEANFPIDGYSNESTFDK